MLESEGIEAEQLYVRATDPLETLYYPARLTTVAPSVAVKQYVFRFRSRGGVGLYETIYRKDEEGRLLEVRKRRHDEDFGGPLEVVWDGRTATGATAPTGVPTQAQGQDLSDGRSQRERRPSVHSSWRNGSLRS